MPSPRTMIAICRSSSHRVRYTPCNGDEPQAAKAGSRPAWAACLHCGSWFLGEIRWLFTPRVSAMIPPSRLLLIPTPTLRVGRRSVSPGRTEEWRSPPMVPIPRRSPCPYTSALTNRSAEIRQASEPRVMQALMQRCSPEESL